MKMNTNRYKLRISWIHNIISAKENNIVCVTMLSVDISKLVSN